MLAREELRIVVVDDSADTTEMMAAMLNEHGYSVREARDAASALALIQQWLPHGVILDIEMPGIDGVELARHIRANYGSGMALIAVSGWDADHPKVREIIDIVDHYLLKPCDFDQLIAWLGDLCEPRRRA